MLLMLDLKSLIKSNPLYFCRISCRRHHGIVGDKFLACTTGKLEPTDNGTCPALAVWNTTHNSLPFCRRMLKLL